MQLESGNLVTIEVCIVYGKFNFYKIMWLQVIWNIEKTLKKKKSLLFWDVKFFCIDSLFISLNSFYELQRPKAFCIQTERACKK